jgi:hypothetical protein
VDFFETLRDLGFSLAEGRHTRGAQTYSAQPNRYLTYWVHVYEDGSSLFTWEFAVTDYLLERGIQLGSSETLNLYMFPREDLPGRQEASWLAEAIDQVEVKLRSIDFADPED